MQTLGVSEAKVSSVCSGQFCSLLVVCHVFFFFTKINFCACSDVIQNAALQKMTCLYASFANDVIKNVNTVSESSGPHSGGYTER